jgi:hypothetical protein
MGAFSMPVLPIIDLLILIGWTCLALGAVLKAIAITTSYRPEIFFLGPFEFVMIAGVLLLLALTLAARTWVKANEPEILAKQRRVSTLHSMTKATAGFEGPGESHLAQQPSNSETSTREVIES